MTRVEENSPLAAAACHFFRPQKLHHVPIRVISPHVLTRVRVRVCLCRCDNPAKPVPCGDKTCRHTYVDCLKVAACNMHTHLHALFRSRALARSFSVCSVNYYCRASHDRPERPLALTSQVRGVLTCEYVRVAGTRRSTLWR